MEINYAIPDANLGKIFRKNLRKEWSYFFDSAIKVFSGKISNFDAIFPEKIARKSQENCKNKVQNHLRCVSKDICCKNYKISTGGE